MRILIIEDDREVAEFLRNSLESLTFAVDVAFDGDKGSYMARTNQYDVIILDNSLPRKNGLEVCMDIRGNRDNVPILVLSVINDPRQKTALINAGADDYIPKPFSFEELVARLRALMRRPRKLETPVLYISDLAIDTNKQLVLRGKKNIYLTRKEFSLLEYLTRNKGVVVSRGMIMEHVWNSESDPFSNTIEAHILNLRKKVRHPQGGEDFIHNVPGRGYIADDTRKICK